MINWSTIVTGIVGIAGIGGSIWSARIARKSATSDLRLSIGAENERVRLAEKRRIYAAYLSCTTRYSLASGMTELARGTGQKFLTQDQAADHTAALVALGNALGEVRLIAPQHIGALADQLSSLLIHSGGASADVGQMRRDLENAMRVDLGERALTAGSNPSPGE